MAFKDELTRELLEINANDYLTWTSGIKSPIYCDNRLTMSYPAVRKKIVTAFAEKIAAMEEKPDIIAGCATAGIPHAAWLAEKLDLPMVYVRSKPKGHGKGNQIEGKISRGQKVLVIEDLISTGGSSIESATALQAEGADVLAVFAIFTYGLKKATDQFAAEAITFDTITNFDALIEALVEDGKLTTTNKSELLEWRNSL